MRTVIWAKLMLAVDGRYLIFLLKEVLQLFCVMSIANVELYVTITDVVLLQMCSPSD